MNVKGGNTAEVEADHRHVLCWQGSVVFADLNVKGFDEVEADLRHVLCCLCLEEVHQHLGLAPWPRGLHGLE